MSFLLGERVVNTSFGSGTVVSHPAPGIYGIVFDCVPEEAREVDETYLQKLKGDAPSDDLRQSITLRDTLPADAGFEFNLAPLIAREVAALEAAIPLDLRPNELGCSERSMLAFARRQGHCGLRDAEDRRIAHRLEQRGLGRVYSSYKTGGYFVAARYGNPKEDNDGAGSVESRGADRSADGSA